MRVQLLQKNEFVENVWPLTLTQPMIIIKTCLCQATNTKRLIFNHFLRGQQN